MEGFLYAIAIGLLVGIGLRGLIKAGVSDAVLEAAYPKAKQARLAAEKKRTARGLKFAGLMVALVVVVLGVAILWAWWSKT